MERGRLTERILNLALQIIYLLTKEIYEPDDKISDHVTSSSQPCVSSDRPSAPCERNSDKKILEVATKIIELLTGEVPIRCQDVAVYFTMEEWEYLEGHCDQYQAAMKEEEPRLTSPDRSRERKSPESFLLPPISPDSAQEELSTQQEDQRKQTMNETCPIMGEEKTEAPMKEESDGSMRRNRPERCPSPFHSQEDLNILQNEQNTTLMNNEAEMVKEEEGEAFLALGVVCEEGGVPEDGPSKIHPLVTSPHPPPTADAMSHEELQMSRNDQGNMNAVKVEAINDGLAYSRGEDNISTGFNSDGVHNGRNGYSYPLIYHDDPAEVGALAGPPGGHYMNWSSITSTHASPLFNIFQHQSISQTTETFPFQRTPVNEASADWTEGHPQAQHPDPNFSAEVRPHLCFVCGKSFRIKSVLIRHKKIHTGEKPYQCFQCGKGFTQKSDMAEHERIHTGEKPYACPECGKCFAKRTNLIRHLRIHSGEKPYACPMCGKAFAQKAAIDEHIRIHTGEKPYSCPHCGKRFAHKSAFAEHQRVHTGARPYSCSECGKCFRQGSVLAKHQQAHAKPKQCPCPQCGRIFLSEFLLTLHERVHQASHQ